ncbi:MAG: response regulator transcription factor [Legionellaceae bacterium]|nr:response regulator transcription factor [Legionellaceae bacterium]
MSGYTNKAHILVIDDDKEINQLISDYLIRHGYHVTSANDGRRIKHLLQDHAIDLIILDIMLPGPNGLDLCKTIRDDHDIPIIMLSAADSTADRVVGLELGADDYMTKPFNARELLARIKANLRRTQGELLPSRQFSHPLKKIRFSSWRLDRETHCLIGQDDIAIILSQREYDVLNIFLEHPNRILSRGQLLDLLYDKENNPFDRAIDVLIGRLRKKIELDPKNPQLLKTVRGGGYQLQATVELSS